MVVCVYFIFSLSVICWWTFGYFHVSAFVNNAVMNVGVQITRCDPDFNSSEYLPRSGIGGLYGSSPFKFLWNIHFIFQSSGTVSHSHPQCMCSVSPHPPQPCQLFFFTPHVVQYILFFFNIYLAVLGLEAHRILVPGLGIALTCPAFQGGFSTTGPPGKS